MNISVDRIRIQSPDSVALFCPKRLLLLSLISSALLCAQSDLNLSFETVVGGAPAGWYSQSEGTSYQFAVDNSTSVDGAQSLRISSSTATAAQFGFSIENLPVGPTVGKTLNLSGYIRTQAVQAYATLWAKAIGPQGSRLAFQNLGTRAPWGTTSWQNYDLSIDIPAGSESVIVGVLLTGSGTAWFDNLRIELDGHPYTDNPTTAQVQWIQANAIPFTSLSPDDDFAELQPLKSIVGNARIVGVGEATHGTSEIWRMKTRLVSFLAQEMGFTILALEANMPEAARLNDYVQTGIGNPGELLKGMNYFNWNMQEILDLIKWMRQYNSSGKGHIEFMGLDVNMATVAMENVIGFVRKADPSLLTSVNSSYAAVGQLMLPGGDTSTLAVYQAGKSAAQRVLDQLQANRAKYLQTMSATEVDWAIQNATVAVQSVHMSIDRIIGDGSARDAAMAANAEWIAARAPAGSRIVLWMHNSHINREPKTTGGILAGHFGSDYMTIGTAFHSGRYFGCTGWGCPGEPTGVMGDFPSLDSFPGSAEYFFHQTGTSRQILDLRLANAKDPASSWLSGWLMFRSIGYSELDGLAEFYSTSRLTQDFDALVFFDQTTAATELPNGPMALAVFAPGNVRCGALNVPYLQALAPGGGSPVSLPDGTAGAVYMQTLRAGGGTCSSWPNTLPASCPKGVWPPYGHWTVTGSVLPAGLTLSPEGALSGTPTQAGTFTFTVETTNNAYPETAAGRISLVVNPARPARKNPGDSSGRATACRDVQRRH